MRVNPMHRLRLPALLLALLFAGGLAAHPRPAAAITDHSLSIQEQPLDLHEDMLGAVQRMMALAAAPTSEQAEAGCNQLLPKITKGGFTDPVYILSDAE